MDSSIEDATSEEPKSSSFPSSSHEFSQVQQTLESVPPTKDKLSLVEPVTQTATVSTVVTTVSPSVTRLPVEGELEGTVSSNTLQTTVVTTVGNTSVVPTAASGVAAVSIAAAAQQRDPIHSCTTPSTSAIQDALLESTERPVSSNSSRVSPHKNVSLSQEAPYVTDKDNIKRENQQLREAIEGIRLKRERFRLLTDKMKKEVKRQLHLIYKYRSFLISTFENRPIHGFQQIIEKMRVYSSGSIPDYTEALSNSSGMERKKQRMPLETYNLKSTADAKAFVTDSSFRATAASSAAVYTRYLDKEPREMDSSSIAYFDRPLVGNVESQEKSDRKVKGKNKNWIIE
ncbi:myb domain-containing protein isoform 2 [Galdieria sulphuraria]|uniref:Myb domain-containing protein isoform 2 n=1 Tax=Galdieria sulphuraria TaxID=130081 RepID=M2Y6U6_GALSU|nr:myb domain-containing protein isoform 2 [Galdieria sulphuraria]EME31574.1 myb domain-containing protein isoform 2 [Galdieria sulphuraria]|eukprot:XP_005708094.1 myb domain-containing protein isoform 2 [Galdieria sulphuraria]